MSSYYNGILPNGISSRTIPVDDLDMHIIDAGNESHPLILLLHGFPEIAFSWRKVIAPIAQLGYHVVAPDQRGYGRTTSRSAPGPVRYEDDVSAYKLLNIVRDVVALVFALGYRSVTTVVGHDAGSRVACFCALIRPDIFKSVISMSSPFPGPPVLPFDVTRNQPAPPPHNIFSPSADASLAALDPPRKYYVPYYAGTDANAEMTAAPDGLHAFLRAYFHMKSADWPQNHPHTLRSHDPTELAQLPLYYMMPRAATMPAAVMPYAPRTEEIAGNRWLPDAELAVYVAEYGRTGFQGGLNWYRVLQPELSAELGVFAGRRVEVPAMFLSGRQDWGPFQTPGALVRVKNELFTWLDEEDIVFVDGAGHWVQQEQPEKFVEHVRRFLQKVAL